MVTVLESIMLVCFGISWPVSVYKSWKTKTTQGKSLIFMLAIIVGYLAGIGGKLLGGQFTYVLALYIVNLAFVSLDLALYFVNKHHEMERRNTAQAA